MPLAIDYLESSMYLYIIQPRASPVSVVGVLHWVVFGSASGVVRLCEMTILQVLNLLFSKYVSFWPSTVRFD
jgi:hypothetical protein